MNTSCQHTAPQSRARAIPGPRAGLLTLAVLGLAALVATPAHAQLTPAGTTLYISLFNSNQVVTLTPGATTVTPFITQASGSTLVNPEGLAFDQAGNLYVANSHGSSPGAASVEKFSSSGTDLGQFGTALNFAAGLAFGPQGNLYVGNALGSNSAGSSGQIAVFAPNGSVLPSLTLPFTPPPMTRWAWRSTGAEASMPRIT
jgi:sugar lactone lactonase YvrE